MHATEYITLGEAAKLAPGDRSPTAVGGGAARACSRVQVPDEPEGAWGGSGLRADDPCEVGPFCSPITSRSRRIHPI